jgi:holliday junction DNA helicase RuvA
MIDYIKGHLEELNPASAVLEANDIGYNISISLNTYSAIQGQKTVRLYVHEIIREDAYELFGFAEKAERSLFRDLISVSGVGANTARLLLSSLSPKNVVSAIISGDVSTLKSVKGLGEKTAQRIIVDLKTKINKNDAFGADFSISLNNTIEKEALSALLVLGFDRLKSEKAISKILASNPQSSVDELIKTALKSM